MSEDQNKIAEKPLDDNIASASKGIAPKSVDVEEGEVPSSQGKSKREDKDSAQAANGNDNKEKGKSKRDKSSEDKSSDDEDAVDKKSKKKKKDKSKKKDKDKKSEKKADKKEKRSHSREKKPSKRDREKSSSRSRSRSKQDSRRKRRSRSRSKDNKRKRDESPNRSKRRSTSRSRRRSSSKQKDRKQDKYRDNRDDRDRSRDERRKSRSPAKREEKTKQSDSRARPEREAKEAPRDSGRDKRRDDVRKENREKKMEVVEDEPLDEEAQKKIESQLAFAEEDEEAIAARAREQRKAMLEQARKAKEEEELAFMQQQQAMAVEEEPVTVEEKVIEKKVKDKPVRKAEKLVKELAEKTESEKTKEVTSIAPAEAGDSLPKMQQEEEGKQNDEKKQQSNYKHDVDKEKYIKMIESMREKLQQEEEDLRENGEGEDGAEDKNKEAEAGKKDEDAQDFDMFCETPESVEEEKVAPIVGVDNTAYDDENGYYRGQIGEVVNGRYKILGKLGKGVFGNVFKGTDMETNQDVAMKVVKSEEIYLMSGLKEKEILQMLNEADRHNKRHVIRLLDSFEYRRHLILVFELMEMDLRSAIKTFGKKLGLSIESVRSYARQLFISLAHLRKHKIIHADLKPDNILVTNNQKTLKLSDFGSAFPVEENTITPYLVARYYRAPEIILGCPYDAAVDMWSAACTIFELYTGKMLFPGRDNNEMLKLILQTKGRFNNKMVKRGEFASQYFDHQNNFLSTEIDPVTRLKYVKPIPIGGKITRDIGNLLNAVEIELSEEDRKKVAQLKDLLERCLTLDPNKRISPDEALRHTFINYTVQKIATDHNTLKHAF